MQFGEFSDRVRLPRVRSSVILPQPLRSLIGICSVLLLLQGPAHAQIGNVEFEAFAGHDSNPSRAQAGDGVGAESVQGVRATWLRSVLLDERSGMILQGGGTFERHSAYSGLNNLALNAGATYRIQPTVGYAMPWYELSLDLNAHRYANSSIRDGISAALELSVGKHFTDRIYSTAGAGVRRSLAGQGYIFDLTQRTLFATLGYRFSLDDTLYVRLSQGRGDQVFGARETYGVSGTAKASGDDPVFGDGYYAYRMDAVANSVEAGVNIPLRGYGALDLRARRSRSRADGGETYDDTLMLISWRYSYF